MLEEMANWMINLFLIDRESLKILLRLNLNKKLRIKNFLKSTQMVVFLEFCLNKVLRLSFLHVLAHHFKIEMYRNLKVQRKQTPLYNKKKKLE